MYEIKDNFLPKSVFKELQNYCNSNEFSIVTAGDKQFSVLEVPENIKNYLKKEGHDIILTFIRSAWNDFDTTWRRHADNIIMGQRIDLASVLYINDAFECDENGTAFYVHEKYGESLPIDISTDEYDRMILEDSEDDSKWEMTQAILGKPNRLLTYPSQSFHSKFPNKITKGVRKVLVAFYIKK